jgi:hypothetical protein
MDAALTLKKVHFASVATAFASSVLPGTKGEIWTGDLDFEIWTRNLDLKSGLEIWTRNLDFEIWTRNLDFEIWTRNLDLKSGF